MSWFKLKLPFKINNQNKKTTTIDNLYKKTNGIPEFFPDTIDHAEEFAKLLLLQRPIILNFNNTSSEQKRRIIDFTCGIAFVLNIDIAKVDKNIYYLTFNKK